MENIDDLTKKIKEILEEAKSGTMDLEKADVLIDGVDKLLRRMNYKSNMPI